MLDILILPLETIRKTKPDKFYMNYNDLCYVNLSNRKFYLYCPYCGEDIAAKYKYDTANHIGMIFCKNCMVGFNLGYPEKDISYVEVVKGLTK
jgi:transcription elongation factor Elf1